MFTITPSDDAFIPGLDPATMYRINQLLTEMANAPSDEPPYGPLSSQGRHNPVLSNFQCNAWIVQGNALPRETTDHRETMAHYHRLLYKRFEFVSSALQLLNVQRNGQRLYEELAKEVTYLRALIVDLPPDNPLVGYTAGLALTLKNYSPWKKVQTFDELMKRSKGLSVERALEAVRMLFGKSNDGSIDFSEDDYRWASVDPLSVDDANESLANLCALIGRTTRLQRQWGIVRQHLGWATEGLDRDYFESLFELAATGTPSTFENDTYNSKRTVKEVTGWMDEREADFHAAVHQYGNVHANLISNRDMLMESVQDVSKQTELPPLHWKVNFNFERHARTYATMVNCIGARILIGKTNAMLKESDGILAKLPESRAKPHDSIDSVLRG